MKQFLLKTTVHWDVVQDELTPTKERVDYLGWKSRTRTINGEKKISITGQMCTEGSAPPDQMHKMTTEKLLLVK